MGIKNIVLALALANAVSLSADINFGSRDSAFIMMNGSSINLSCSTLSDGTLRDLEGGSIYDNEMHCSNMTIEEWDNCKNETKKKVVDGDVWVNDEIDLYDGQKLTLSGGKCSEYVYLYPNSGAVIEGYGSFGDEIYVDSNSQLTMRFATALNQNIHLYADDATTTLKLEQDLSFMPGNSIITEIDNEGTCELRCCGHRLSLGGDANNETVLPGLLDVHQGAITLTGPVTVQNCQQVNFHWRAEIEGNGNTLTFGDSSSALSTNDACARVLLKNITLANVHRESLIGDGAWDMSKCCLEKCGQILEVNGTVTGGDVYHIGDFNTGAGYTGNGYYNDTPDDYYTPITPGDVDVFGCHGATFAQSPTGESVLELHADVTVRGQWKFVDDFTIIGNGYNLDLSSGQIKVATGKTVKLDNVRITGANSNSLLYEYINTPYQWVVTRSQTIENMTVTPVVSDYTSHSATINTGGVTAYLDENENPVSVTVITQTPLYKNLLVNGTSVRVVTRPMITSTVAVTVDGTDATYTVLDSDTVLGDPVAVVSFTPISTFYSSHMETVNTGGATPYLNDLGHPVFRTVITQTPTYTEFTVGGSPMYVFDQPMLTRTVQLTVDGDNLSYNVLDADAVLGSPVAVQRVTQTVAYTAQYLNSPVVGGDESIVTNEYWSGQYYSSGAVQGLNGGSTFTLINRALTTDTTRALAVTGEDTGTGYLVVNDGAFELSNVVVTLGCEDVEWQSNISVTGPLTIVTGSNRFSGYNMSLSGGTVHYDTQGAPDNYNVRIAGVTEGDSRLFLVGDSVDGVDTLYIDQDTQLNKNLYLYNQDSDNVRSLTVQCTSSATWYGNGRSVVFPYAEGLCGSQVLFIDNCRKLTTENMILEGYVPSRHLVLGDGNSSFNIGNETLVRLHQDICLNDQMKFGSHCGSDETMTLDLNGHTIDMSDGSIFLQGNSGNTLIIKNGRLTNVCDSNLSINGCSTIRLENVELSLSDDFWFGTGKIHIRGNCRLTGYTGCSFIYTTGDSFHIDENSTFTIGNGMIYSHNTDSHFRFCDETSRLELIGGTLRHPDNADHTLWLTNGTLVVDHKSYIQPGSCGITFNNSLNIEILPGASINLSTAYDCGCETASAGTFTYDNC